MITNRQLNDTFVTPKIRAYLYKKLASVSREDVDIRIEELLKYLNMAIYSQGDIPFSAQIDEVWHFWILETQEYTALCKKLCGGLFLHHSSTDYMSYDKPNFLTEKTDLKRGIEILLSYVLNYGGFDQERLKYWPVAQLLSKQWEGRADNLNAWLYAQLDDCQGRLMLQAG